MALWYIMYLCILYYIYTYIYIYIWYVPIFICTQVNIKLYIYVYIHIKHIHTHINSLYIYIYIYVYPLYISYIYIYIGCIILWCEYYDMIPEIISAPLRSQVLPVHAPQNGISSESKPRQPGTPRGSGPEPRENHGKTMGKPWGNDGWYGWMGFEYDPVVKVYITIWYYMEKSTIFWWETVTIFMAIFHSYVKLPEFRCNT